MGLKRHLLAAAVVLSVAITASADIPNWVGNQTTLNVCTSPYTPMVTCTNDTDASNYSGYEVELARKVFALVGWQPSMLTWLCLDWEEMMAHLRAGDGVCNLAAAGVMVSTAEIANGIVFSWPTYQNGLGVAIINNQRAASIWAFANAFSWDVWIVTVLTCLSVGLIVFIMVRKDRYTCMLKAPVGGASLLNQALAFHFMRCRIVLWRGGQVHRSCNAHL